MKTTITTKEKLQLLGILTLARSHQKVIDECEQLMVDLLDDEEVRGSHLTDAIWDTTTLDTVLGLMDIKVKNKKESL